MRCVQTTADSTAAVLILAGLQERSPRIGGSSHQGGAPAATCLRQICMHGMHSVGQVKWVKWTGRERQSGRGGFLGGAPRRWKHASRQLVAGVCTNAPTPPPPSHPTPGKHQASSA